MISSNAIFVQYNGQQIGPISIDEVLSRWQRGEFSDAAHYWHHGLTDWQPLSQLKPDAANAPNPGASKFTRPDENRYHARYKLATPGSRFMAGLIDTGILLIPCILLEIVLPFVGGLVLSGLYTVLMMSSSAHQGTLGMAAMKIAVVDEHGRTITIGKAFTRLVVSIGSMLVLCIGYLAMFFNANRQTWHDSVASTFVIDR